MKSTIKSYDFIDWFATGTKRGATRADIARTLRALVDRLETWRVRAETRRELEWLNDSQLKDLGISADEARSEANKPFWRP